MVKARLGVWIEIQISVIAHIINFCTELFTTLTNN